MLDPLRPWLIEVRQLGSPVSRIVRTYRGIYATTAEGALSQARERWGKALGRDEWFTIGLPGQRN